MAKQKAYKDMSPAEKLAYDREMRGRVNAEQLASVEKFSPEWYALTAMAKVGVELDAKK